MLMYPDHLENWLDFGHHLLIFLILEAFRLSETGQICDFWAFYWELKGRMASNLACWCILKAFRTDYILVMVCWYSSFWCHFDLVKQVKFGVSRIFFRMHGRNGLKLTCRCILTIFGTDYIHGLLVFLIFAPFSLSEAGQMRRFRAFLWPCMRGMGRNLLWSSLSCISPEKRQILAHENYQVTQRARGITDYWVVRLF